MFQQDCFSAGNFYPSNSSCPVGPSTLFLFYWTLFLFCRFLQHFQQCSIAAAAFTRIHQQLHTTLNHLYYFCYPIFWFFVTTTTATTVLCFYCFIHSHAFVHSFPLTQWLFGFLLARLSFSFLNTRSTFWLPSSIHFSFLMFTFD